MNILNRLLKLTEVVIAIILIIFLFKWCIQGGQKLPFSSKSNKVKEVEVEVVKRGKTREEVIASGRINSTSIIRIKSKTSGIVKLLSCKEGDEVKKGDVLCIIKNPAIFGESKEIEKALFHKRFKIVEDYLHKIYSKNLEQLESAKINYITSFERYKKLQLLYREGAISKQELQESEIAYKRAKFQYYVARSSFEEELELTRVRASFKGKIVLSNTTEGIWVESGSELFLLADMSSLIAKVIVDEGEIEKIKIGQKVEIAGDTFTPYILLGEVEKIGNYIFQTEKGLPGIEVICKLNQERGIANPTYATAIVDA